jgi:hypothetical protein
MRNYKNEYTKYQGSPAQKKKRASRNAARNTLKKAGIVKKGDGKDVNHRNGNPMDNRAKNLQVTTKRANRSFPRNSKAGKR